MDFRTARAQAKIAAAALTTLRSCDKDQLNALLSYFASSTNSAALGVLLDVGADPNSVDELGRTPLNRAVHYGRTDNVALLVDRGARLDWQDDCGNTILHFAARLPFRSAAECLIAKGASLVEKNLDGKTPVDLGTENDCVAVRDYFRNYGTVKQAVVASCR